MRLMILLCATLATPSFASSQDAAALDVYGTWLTASGNSKIEIIDCGNQTPCGKIIWINEPTPDLLRDDRNKDPALRERTILGLTILEGFTAKKDQWKKGEIYDPESGKTYGAKLRRLAGGALQVKGCIGPICQTRLWAPIAKNIAAD